MDKLDELIKLAKKDFNSSADFSKRVMEKIEFLPAKKRKQHRVSVWKLASVAALVISGVSIFGINQYKPGMPIAVDKTKAPQTELSATPSDSNVANSSKPTPTSATKSELTKISTEIENSIQSIELELASNESLLDSADLNSLDQ